METAKASPSGLFWRLSMLGESVYWICKSCQSQYFASCFSGRLSVGEIKMFNLKSAAFCLEIWSCVGDGEIGGLQAIRQRKALTFISDVPSPTAAWNNKISVVEQLVGTVWMHIFQGPHCHIHLTKLLIKIWAHNLDNLRHYWSPNVHPLFDLSAGVHTWCWTRDIQEPERGEYFWQQDVSICKIKNLGGVNTFDSKMFQFVRSIIFSPEFSLLHWWPADCWAGRSWISTPKFNNC